VAKFYGSDPQFIACSATIANPAELAQRLTEAEFECISENGAPSGEKFTQTLLRLAAGLNPLGSRLSLSRQ
jgi:ATP-dependent helicase YprA (DUF1998 family)